MKTQKAEQSRPRREYWRELIAQQEHSGLTVHGFCVQRGVTEASFYYWRKQLRDNAPVRFALVEQSVNRFRQDAPLEVLLTSGERVQVAPDTDAATLRMVLAVLRERA
jgi:transposase-like protein